MTSTYSAAQSLIKYHPDAAVSYESTDEPTIEDVEATPTLEDSEKDAIASALRRNNGNKKLAAQQLNISQRTLYRKIHEFGLDLTEGSESDNDEQ